MPKYFRIRKMDIVDVPAVAALVKEFSLYMHALGETSDLKLDAESLERDGFGTEPAFQGIVAEESPLISGFLLYHSGYDTDAACRLVFVVDLFVTKRAQGQGIGFALMTEALRAGLARMQEIGGAQPGDRTMVDALLPALDALVDQGLPAAARAAREGADRTARMTRAKAGRSAYINADQLAGNVDPGAEAVARLLEQLAH